MWQDGFMEFTISHDRGEETLMAKARWFHSLTFEQRIDVFNAFTELILSANPNIADRKDAEQIKRGIHIIRMPRWAASHPRSTL